jgi:hypothetical protein
MLLFTEQTIAELALPLIPIAVNEAIYTLPGEVLKVWETYDVA